MKKIEIEIPDGYEFDKETMSIVPVKDETEYIDLGLTSGTLWAKTNVGAEDEIDYGNYFDYGEAQQYNCPTKEQIEELINECVWVWVAMIKCNREAKGYQVTGKNGNYIFLPAAGYRDDSSLYLAGSYGYYWSSSLSTSYSGHAYYLYFYSSYVVWHYGSRFYGRSVRTVINLNKTNKL